MDRLKVAIIGLGKMGLLHSCILGTIPPVEVIAYCDKSRILRKIAKNLFKQALIFDDVEKLGDLHLDCVFVTVPIPAHFSVVNTLYLKNITSNVFVEKTLASTIGQANELCTLAKDSAVNMVGYMKRFSSTFSKAKSLLSENVLGELVSFQGSAFSSDFAACNKSPKNMSRGGVLSDLGSHIIDLALWFFGDFKVEESNIKSVISERSEDSVNFTVRKSGLSGEFDISWCKENYRMPNFAMTIQGTQGSLEVNDYVVVLTHDKGEQLTWHRPELNDNVPFLLGESEYYREDEYFVKSILSGKKAEPSFRTASKVDDIIEQARGY
jgi:predicted dehydrogenase